MGSASADAWRAPRRCREDRAGELVIILAGYHKEMTTFLNTNPGLHSRIPNTFNFADYTSEEMARILAHVVEAKGFELAEELTHDACVSLVQQVRCLTALPRPPRPAAPPPRPASRPPASALADGP